MCFKGKIAQISDQNLKRLCLADLWHVLLWAREESEREESSSGLEQQSVSFSFYSVGSVGSFTGSRTEV